ncbi:MAG TPA: Zn-ribbon domain-containing OB-fold protein [Anaerolineales bacterium]|nr:Zn-ribbon domain-containing OB-fold protein [Anaerolineales bacterium]
MTSRIKKFPGTSLSEKDFDEGKVLFVHDELKADYAWDTGIAIGSYLAGLKRGVILGSRCDHCHKIVVPPRTVCEWCFNPMNEFVPVKDTGTINTFSLCYVTWDVKRITEPEIPAVIMLDGASELSESSVIMGGIMHKIGEVDPQKVHIDMHVQAVWKPESEREGSITDILYFKPVDYEK